MNPTLKEFMEHMDALKEIYIKAKNAKIANGGSWEYFNEVYLLDALLEYLDDVAVFLKEHEAQWEVKFKDV